VFGSTDKEDKERRDNINEDLKEVFVRMAGEWKWFMVVTSFGLWYWQCEPKC
jgi:hypothetical protein